MSQDSHTTRQPLFLEREPVEGRCPRCGVEQLRSYPVYSEGGWFDVVKCQNCLLSVSRERGPRLGPIQLLSDLL
jgi:transcription elongation factor Elf1